MLKYTKNLVFLQYILAMQFPTCHFVECDLMLAYNAALDEVPEKKKRIPRGETSLGFRCFFLRDQISPSGVLSAVIPT